MCDGQGAHLLVVAVGVLDAGFSFLASFSGRVFLVFGLQTQEGGERREMLIGLKQRLTLPLC